VGEARSASGASTTLVSCFCAEWCSSCREYRETFRQIQQQYPEARFLWIDIEDQPDVVGDISVEDFPTLLIATGAGPRFFGPLTPQRDVLMRLIEAHQNDIDGAALPDRELWALVARLRAS
jgi:thiol-disulfide isomerase/thioredoxin